MHLITISKFYQTAGKADWIFLDQCCVLPSTCPVILSVSRAGTTQPTSRNTHWHVVVFVFAQGILVDSTTLTAFRWAVQFVSGTCQNQPGTGGHSVWLTALSHFDTLVPLYWKTHGPQKTNSITSGILQSFSATHRCCPYPAWGQLKVAALQLVFGSGNMRAKGKRVAMLLRTVKWVCVYTIFGYKTPLFSHTLKPFS